MSRFTRFLFTCSLVVTSSTAFADRASEPQLAQPHFAQPPTAAHVAPPPHQLRPRDPNDMQRLPALDRATVRAALAHNREQNLAAFRVYVKAGVYPSNTFQDRKLNVWRDEDGHYCAAATIIRQSGQDALVGRVAEQSNFIRLADVRQGPLMDWILTSGFTQDEIAAIQEPFEPVMKKPAPEDPRIVDARMRKAEDARLEARYAEVDKQLVKNQKASLELATDRLMKMPAIAWQLVASQELDE